MVYAIVEKVPFRYIKLKGGISLLGLPYKDHRVGDLNNRNVFPHSSGGWKSEVKVSVGLVSSEVSLLGLKMPCSLCVLTWSSLCVSLYPDLFL